MRQKQKILVTGASGFVGEAIVREFQQSGDYEIYCLAGRKGDFNFEDTKNIEMILYGDVSDYSSLKNIENTGNIDFLIHSAGLAHQFGKTSGEDFWRVNVNGTDNVCSLAQKLGVKHFVLISSVSVYGQYGNAPVDEEFDCKPEGLYAESKLESEIRAGEICERNNISLTVLRLATVIGEGDRGNTARLITAVDKNKFMWIGKGINKKSLIYKNDVARAVLSVIEKHTEKHTEIYNLTGETLTISEVVSEIYRNLGKKGTRFGIPEALPRGIFRLNEKTFSLSFLKKYEKTFEKWLSDDVYSGAKFSKQFDFEPKTSIAEAIAKQVGHYLNSKKSKN